MKVISPNYALSFASADIDGFVNHQTVKERLDCILNPSLNDYHNTKYCGKTLVHFKQWFDKTYIANERFIFPVAKLISAPDEFDIYHNLQEYEFGFADRVTEIQKIDPSVLDNTILSDIIDNNFYDQMVMGLVLDSWVNKFHKTCFDCKTERALPKGCYSFQVVLVQVRVSHTCTHHAGYHTYPAEPYGPGEVSLIREYATTVSVKGYQKLPAKQRQGKQQYDADDQKEMER